ncbi:ribosomal protein S12 methylthiotransferase accessory factor [Lentzea xinjiangensis]|uniref:Ribosomal protein S12 methylthiotransferase accessory factor n=1 Tax=Lentzea xinjiangensis TaxID=402600 RepID=A0A1H9LVL1_9PSEU|nr:YcaO-like family protein [Lentzea xinjiangensis]SER15522.1 ribosomal protein S12 methylthiotransferase accessory factor [Lentzea xinjiangensis]
MITYSSGAPPRLRADGSLTLIGPTSGVCPKCAEQARLAVSGAPSQDIDLGGLVPPAFQALVEVLHEQDHHDTVIAIRTDLAVVQTHRVNPGTHCCTPPPAPPPRTAVEQGQLRSANHLTTVDGLRDAVVDFRHGRVTALFRTSHLPLATVTAELDGHTAGYGRTSTFAEAERVAVFEAVERHNGMRPRLAGATEASYAELGGEALDPARLGLCDFDQRYTPDLTMRWVPAWSYTAGRSLLVPEQVAYYAAETPPGQRFVHETSNGCGLGNSLPEAVLHGLFEVAERDAFLMAWYGRTPLKSIKRPDDPLLHHLTDRLEELGYELVFLDATNDLGIPAVLTLARTERATLPRAFFAAGASPDPLAAMRSAAAEVAVDVESYVDRVRANPGDHDGRRLRQLLRDPALVRTMDDHVAVNTLPEAVDRYAFLVSGEQTDLPDRRDHTDLEELLDRYAGRLEVIAVDQTDPVTASRLGLHSAKVIVPGALPMTFGHLHRRTRGLPRLAEVLNPHPHPFP